MENSICLADSPDDEALDSCEENDHCLQTGACEFENDGYCNVRRS